MYGQYISLADMSTVSQKPSVCVQQCSQLCRSSFLKDRPVRSLKAKSVSSGRTGECNMHMSVFRSAATLKY